MAAIRPFHPRAWLRVGLACVFAALSCGAAAIPARAEGKHVGLDLGIRALFGAGDMSNYAKPSFGPDVGLTIGGLDRGFGIRTMFAFHALTSEHMPLSPAFSFSTDPSFDTAQDLYWFGLGPRWTFPHGDTRTEVYLLFGKSKVSTSSDAHWTLVWGEFPSKASTSMIVTGAMWTPSRKSRFRRFELGGELMFGKEATFYDSPPAESDGAGGYVTRTSVATITGAVLRLGFHLRQ